jgi:hypothetical protein
MMNWLVAIAVGLCIGLIEANSPAEAAEGRPAVVELFTSQGCSSCPPADQLLAELAQRSDIIALGFHIDYWDSLGWKDPLSTSEGTARQRSYARLLGNGQVYTPQMIVEGTREMVGSRRGEVLAALHETRPQAIAPVAFAADRRSVTIGPTVTPGATGTILLVRFVKERKTQIGAGENANRTARDVNGVEGLQTLGAWQGGEVRFSIDPPSADHSIAVLVQAADGRMLGAAALQGS